MKFIDASGVEFACPVTFSGGVTPELSLGNIDSLDISGNVIAAGNGQFGGDVSVGDALTIGGNANIGAGLTVTGSAVVDGGLQTNGDFSASGTGTVNGAFTCYSLGTFGSLFTPGAITAGDVEFTSVETSAGIACGTTLAVGGAITAATTLAVAGTSTLHGTSVIGTLSVSAATTLAAASSTALTASTSLTVSGASIVGLHEHVSVDVATLVGAGATVYGIPCPVAGTVTKIQSRLKAALTTGDATLTAKIGATSITNGVITITQAGSAAGDIDVANPTAQNTVAVGSNLTVTVGGTNDAVVGATVVFTILRSA